MFYVGIYAAITLGTATMGIVTNVIEYIGAYRASRILFQRLLVTVVRAPFRWFDVTPTGKIAAMTADRKLISSPRSYSEPLQQ